MNFTHNGRNFAVRDRQIFYGLIPISNPSVGLLRASGLQKAPVFNIDDYR